MPAIKDPPRMRRTKCYIHEMQRPLELAYSRLQHHVCPICHARLLELAKTSFQFKLRDQVVIISVKPEVGDEMAVPGKVDKVKKTRKAKKATA